MASWFFSLLGKISGNVAEVDASNQLLVALNQDPTKAGAVRLYDSTGNRIVVEENGSLSVSQDNLIFSEQVDGNAVNTNKWISSASVLATAQAGGFITLNSANVTTINGYAILTSILNLPFYGDLPTEITFSAKIGAMPQANATMELGIGYAATNATPTDGAFFRWTPAGAFQAVVNNSGAETVAAIASAPSTGAKHTFSIVTAEDHVMFTLDDVQVADIDNPSGISYPFGSGHQPMFARVITGAVAPVQAPSIAIGQVTAVQLSINQYRTWQDVLADLGLTGYQSPLTPFTQSANRANSPAAASLALSNTVPSLTTLGGEWQIAAPAGAVTDYALFAFQVPTPYRMKVYGIRISTSVVGANVASPTELDWVLGINSSAASLATTDSPPTSWAPRRITLGGQTFNNGASAGYGPPDFVQAFKAPLIVDAARFFHVILRIPYGAATASLLYRGSVFIDAQFE